jgi:hypothetical protein
VVSQHWGGDAVVSMASQGSWAVQRRDAADEARLEPCGDALIGALIVNQGKVVRASQLIASVRLTTGDGEERDVPTDAGLQNQWLTASAAIYALE